MRRDPGHVGPNRQAMALRRTLVPDPFVADGYQFGYVAALHGSFASALAADASIGDQILSLDAAPSINDFLLVGAPRANPPLRVTAVAGSGPYSVSIVPPIKTAEASGTAVATLHTVDVNLDQSEGLAATTQLVWGIRYLASYSPTVYDYVALARTRPSAGAGSDRFVLGTFA